MRIVLLLLPLFLLGCHQANENLKFHYVENKFKKVKTIEKVKEVHKLEKSS